LRLTAKRALNDLACVTKLCHDYPTFRPTALHIWGLQWLDAHWLCATAATMGIQRMGPVRSTADRDEMTSSMIP
jgi:hypothetical protein